jgi:hypothetical protein
VASGFLRRLICLVVSELACLFYTDERLLAAA